MKHENDLAHASSRASGKSQGQRFSRRRMYGKSSGYILSKCPLLSSGIMDMIACTITYFWRGRSSIGGRTCPCGRASVRRIKGCCCNLQCGTEGRSDGLRLPPAGGREGGTYPVRGETDRVVSSRGRAASRERSGGSRRVKANQKAARPRTTTVQYSTTCSTTLFNIHTHSLRPTKQAKSGSLPAVRPSVRPSGLVLARVAVSSGRIFN